MSASPQHPMRQSGKPQAFLVHLALSAALVGALGFAMLAQWYPLPYFSFDGGWQVLRIIILVDVVLGPLLTLIVFRRGKPGLRRDLALIAALQLAALVYGGAVMVLYRPAFVVYAENNFFTVANADVMRNTRNTVRLELFRPHRGPGFVALDLPADPAERERLRDQMRRGGPPITWLGDYYRPLDSATWQRIFDRSVPIETLAAQDARIGADLRDFAARHSRPIADFAFVPVSGRYGVVLIVFDRASRVPVDWLQ